MAVNSYVFIVGCPRSETTLLQRIVDTHPDIAVVFETHSIPRWLGKRRGDYNLEYLRESYDLATDNMRRIYDAALVRTGTMLRWAYPHLGAEIEETIGAVVASLEEVPPAPNHRDLFARQELDWPDKIATLLEEARASLAGRVW